MYLPLLNKMDIIVAEEKLMIVVDLPGFSARTMRKNAKQDKDKVPGGVCTVELDHETRALKISGRRNLSYLNIEPPRPQDTDVAEKKPPNFVVYNSSIDPRRERKEGEFERVYTVESKYHLPTTPLWSIVNGSLVAVFAAVPKVLPTNEPVIYDIDE